MDFSERLSALASKVLDEAVSVETEEATKNAFVMPFIANVLGYDVFDPKEVVPEFTADVGIKRGEKVDYAIVKDGEVQILIECKINKGELKIEHASQLYRYFGVTNARVAVLTNGVVWQFYSDVDAPNRMDQKPFLVLDLRDIDDTVVPEIQKLSKASFDLDSIVSAAEELKYVGAIKREIGAVFKEPTVELVKFFTSRVYDGAFTARVREQFSPLVVKAIRRYLNDQVNGRLKAALSAVPAAVDDTDHGTADDGAATDHVDPDGDGIETTAEELLGYRIVKAIACSEVKPERITQRDSKSYFAILLDDNNRRPIARLHFNASSAKYLGLLDEDKRETRHPITSLDGIYAFAEQIREAVRRYA